MEHLALQLKALDNLNTLMIVRYLFRQGPVNINPLSEALDISQPEVTRLTQRLEDVGLVDRKKTGRYVTVSLRDSGSSLRYWIEENL